jgi:hypothetical protein
LLAAEGEAMGELTAKVLAAQNGFALFLRDARQGTLARGMF